jgi:hypothetical protein
MNMLGTIIEQSKANGPTPEDWRRYVELRQKAKPNAKEVAEFEALLQKLNISLAEAELHETLLCEAEQLKSLIAQEPNVQAEEEAAFKADGAVCARITGEIIERQLALARKDYPERKVYNAIRQKKRDIIFAHGELATLKTRWPGLFGLPLDTPRNGSYSYPTATAKKMTELKIPF